MQYADKDEVTPPRSLGRYAPAVRLRRALPAQTRRAECLSTGSGDNARNNMCEEDGEGWGVAPFFHRLRLPWRASQNQTLQTSGRRNPMRLKDAGSFPPAAPSCSPAFLSFGLPVSFRCYGRGSLIPRPTLSSG